MKTIKFECYINPLTHWIDNLYKIHFRNEKLFLTTTLFRFDVLLDDEDVLKGIREGLDMINGNEISKIKITSNG